MNLVTFATWRYERSRKRLLSSARQFCNFRCWNFTGDDFRKTDAYVNYPDVTRRPRGAGLWLWKPYYIREVLTQLKEGDRLVYLDAGFEIIAPLEPLISLVDDGPGVAVFKVHEHLNRHWTKRDCFVLMGCDDQKYLDIEQTMSGILILRKSPFVMDLLDEWFNYQTDPRIVSDDPNVLGFPNYEGFVEHRHDQSILCNLLIRNGILGYTDPSQYGEEYRPLATPGVDDYPTLLNLHRERLPSWRTALRLAYSEPGQFMRGVKKHLGRFVRNSRV